MDHAELEPKAALHRPGCLSSHESCYIEGNPCSYRWHAARRARADSRIQYINAHAITKQRWCETEHRVEKLERWVTRGKATNLVVRGGKLRFTLASFTTGWWPWDNHVHHIIPHGSLQGTLEEIAAKAEPRADQAFIVMKDGLYDEPYNINDGPNVLVLPIRNADAEAMGLPRHLLGSGSGSCSHPDYSKAVQQELGKRVTPHYQGLIAAIRSRKHREDEEVPAVRPVLETLSEETYEEILSKTVTYRESGGDDVCLDDIAPLLYR